MMGLRCRKKFDDFWPFGMMDGWTDTGRLLIALCGKITQ